MTIDAANLLWLKGRAASRKKKSLSDALDDILTQARQGGPGADAARSVIGTIDIADMDEDLGGADPAVRTLFDESLGRPVLLREPRPAFPARPGATPALRKPGRG